MFLFLQAGLIRESPTKEYLEEHAQVLLHKNLESLYACKGGNWFAFFSNSPFLISSHEDPLNWVPSCLMIYWSFRPHTLIFFITKSSKTLFVSVFTYFLALCLHIAVSENEFHKILIEAIPKILNWIHLFRDSEVNVSLYLRY